MTPNNVFFIGAPKCATTSLYQVFRKRKDVFVSSTKETMHFIKDYWEGDQNYYDSIEGRGDRPMLDFQPNHCLYPYVPERIRQTVGEFQVVLIVREPIARAYSEMCHFRDMRPGRLDDDFNTIIMWNMLHFDEHLFENEAEYMRQADPRGGCYRPNFIENGVYINHMRRFSDCRMTVIEYESLLNTGMEGVNILCDKLDMPRFKDHIKLPKANSKTDDSFFDEDVISLMREFYKPYNNALSDALGANFEERWYGETE